MTNLCISKDSSILFLNKTKQDFPPLCLPPPLHASVGLTLVGSRQTWQHPDTLMWFIVCSESAEEMTTPIWPLPSYQPLIKKQKTLRLVVAYSSNPRTEGELNIVRLKCLHLFYFVLLQRTLKQWVRWKNCAVNFTQSVLSQIFKKSVTCSFSCLKIQIVHDFFLFSVIYWIAAKHDSNKGTQLKFSIIFIFISSKNKNFTIFIFIRIPEIPKQ